MTKPLGFKEMNYPVINCKPDSLYAKQLKIVLVWSWVFPAGSVSKETTCNAGDKGDWSSIPGSGRSPGGGHGSPLQYSCLGNPMDFPPGYSLWGRKELDITEWLTQTSLIIRNWSTVSLSNFFKVTDLVKLEIEPRSFWPKSPGSFFYILLCKRRKIVALKQLRIFQVPSKAASITDHFRAAGI